MTAAQRWLARLALVAAAAAVLVPLLAIGLRASLAVVVTGVVGLALAAAGVWWALTHKGLARWLAVAVAVAAPLVVLVLYTSRGLLWVVVVAIGLLVGGGGRRPGGAGPATQPPSGWSSMTLRRPGGRS